MLELIRDGQYSEAELMRLGNSILGRREVMSATPDMIEDVQIEGTFRDSTKLVAVLRDIGALSSGIGKTSPCSSVRHRSMMVMC